MSSTTRRNTYIVSVEYSNGNIAGIPVLSPAKSAEGLAADINHHWLQGESSYRLGNSVLGFAHIRRIDVSEAE